MSEVDTYLAALPQSQRVELEKIRSIVKHMVPDSEELISYKMPTFKYKGKSLIHFAAFTNHMSLFPASGRITEKLGDKLADFKTSKGTLQFTVEQPIPEAIIVKIIQLRIQEITRN
jgi:uncharacterized protein YdhG (YjbR/CyaY superfamily)